ncbi:MAG: hypothetical protein HYX60_04785 [Legionella longbeachae]|nr:hypothetical protein [Legionella longbeachae]
MKRLNIAFGLVAGIFSASALASEPAKISPVVIPEVKHDVSMTLKEMALTAPVAVQAPSHEVPIHTVPLKLKPLEHNFIDEAIQSSIQWPLNTIPGLNFLGLGVGFPGFTPSSFPPDTNASVGLTQVVQWVNTSFAIFDKSTGLLVSGPTPGNAFWVGFGGPCENDNDGDPIVKYDQLANRWVMTQFAVGDPNHNTQCVAVSTSPDATGTYNRYAFDFGTNFNDYGKLGVWPDAYYMLLVMFPAGEPDEEDLAHALPTEGGPAACALDRNSMLAGNTASIQCFQPDPAAGIFLPSDLDGHIPPPKGEPNFFIGLLQDQDGVTSTNHLAVWRFFVDWQDPNNSQFVGPTALRVKEFNPDICDNTSGNVEGDCAVQQGTDVKLEVLADRPMYRLAYRNFILHQSLVLNHNVRVGDQMPGTRWYELRKSLLRPKLHVHQQGTYMPNDGNGRWMGSIAMDKWGNIALGYSVSGPNLYPSIRYTGRAFFDLRNYMRSENTIVNGGGYQLPFSEGRRNRWGDYSSMAIDPSDDCTFWYTTEFIQTTGIANWSTQIASFRFPFCK